MQTSEELLSIQEVSRLLKVPKHTLRFWEKEFQGVITPLRTQGGQRRYTAENISVVKEIQKLKKTGLNLSEIKRTLTRAHKNQAEPSSPIELDHLTERVAEIVRAELRKYFKKDDASEDFKTNM